MPQSWSLPPKTWGGQILGDQVLQDTYLYAGWHRGLGTEAGVSPCGLVREVVSSGPKLINSKSIPSRPESRCGERAPLQVECGGRPGLAGAEGGRRKSPREGRGSWREGGLVDVEGREQREESQVRRKKGPAGGGKGDVFSAAAPLISLNFSSLIRDLQQNPSLWEDICFTGLCCQTEGGLSLVGAEEGQPDEEKALEGCPVSRPEPNPLHQ